MVQCSHCLSSRAIIRRPRSGLPVCKECFFDLFEELVHQTIVGEGLFHPGDKVAIAVSGGKDSTVLAHVLTALKKRHNYDIELTLLSIDEGISGYRDDSLETVKKNQTEYQLPLRILTYKELYNGWSMDQVVERVGKKNNCTYCGVFRRQALDRGAVLIGATTIVTGHNADDMAETVLLNCKAQLLLLVLRGDLPRLARCTHIRTLVDESSQDTSWTVPRSKPFKYVFEKEIVMYGQHYQYLLECKYAPNAYRGFARSFLKELERIDPKFITSIALSLTLDIITSGESFSTLVPSTIPGSRVSLEKCTKCGYISSNKVCKACILLEGLDKNIPGYRFILFV